MSIKSTANILLQDNGELVAIRAWEKTLRNCVSEKMAWLHMKISTMLRDVQKYERRYD